MKRAWQKLPQKEMYFSGEFHEGVESNSMILISIPKVIQ
jgi:hypothetical protein